MTTGARVTIVLGKGGVGKTTLAAAFAAQRASAGERVLLLSLTSHESLLSRLRVEGDGLDVGKNLDLLELRPKALVDDIVRKITRLGAMSEVLVRSPAYESLVEIAPGVRELAVLNLVFNERRRGYDRIVLDGPATGHGLHLLEAPRKTAQILVGKLRERAEEIDATLRDRAATDVVLVTLPEETPVRETVELATALRVQGFPVDNVVVNRWLPRAFAEPAPVRVLAALEQSPEARRKLGRSIAHRTRIDVEQWFTAVRLVKGQRDENVEYLREVLRLDAKVALVPTFPDAAGRLAQVAAAMATPVPASEMPPPREVAA